MEEITKHHSSQVESDTSLSRKRPRKDCAVDNLHSGETNLEFSVLLTSWNAEGLKPLHLNTIDADNNTHMVEFDHEYVKHKELQCENTNLSETAVTKEAMPPTQDYTHPISSAVSANIAEGGLPCQGKDEPLGSHPKDYAGAGSALPHTLDDPGTDMSALKDCGGPGISLQRLSCVEEVRSKENSDGELSTVIFQSSGEGIDGGKRQPDCITGNEDVIQDKCFYEMRFETCVVEERNQSWDEQGVLQNSLRSEVERHTSHSDYRVSKSSSFSRPPHSPSGGCAREHRENEENVATWEGDVKEKTNVRGEETKAGGDAVNNHISTPTEANGYDKGLMVTGDVAFDSHKQSQGAEINTGLRQDNLHVATEDYVTGEVTADAPNQTPGDHTSGEKLPGRITQRAAEGDNGAGLFSVIDPAIWREVDRAFEEKGSGTNGSTGVEMSPSVALILERATSWPTAPHGETEDELLKQSGCSQLSNGTQQHGGENGGPCRSSAERDCFTSATAIEGRVAGGNGAHLGRPQSSGSPAGPTESPDASCQSEAEAAGHPWEEQRAASQVHSSLDYPRTESEETESALYSLIDRVLRSNQALDAIGWSAEEMHSGQHFEVARSENAVEQDTAHKSDVMATPTDEWIKDWAEGKLSKCGDASAFRLPADDVTGYEVPLTDHGHRTETFTAGSEDEGELFSSLNSMLTGDAVAPGPYSNIACDNAVVHSNKNNGNQRSGAAPSTPVHSHCGPGVYDTFEKIQLSLCDEGGLEDSPLLTSTPSQDYQGLQLPLYHHDLVPDAESQDREEKEEEGEEELNREYGDYHTVDRSCEVPSFLPSHCPLLLLSPSSKQPSQFVPASYETARSDLRPPTNDTALTTESDTLLSDNRDFPEFEMKERFDMVLEELSLYFEISRHDSAHKSLPWPSPEHSVCGDGFREVCDNTSSTGDCPSSPTTQSNRDASIGDNTGEDRALKVFGVKPETISMGGSGYREQEVPLDGSHHCPEGEETMYASVKHEEPRKTEEKRKIWTSSFMSSTEQEQLKPSQPEKTMRLEPLRTCMRPIRVGLSKRAKTKHLHPYK